MNVLLNLPDVTDVITVTAVMNNGKTTYVCVHACSPKDVSELDFSWLKDVKQIERKEE